jgi:hypothetical protein
MAFWQLNGVEINQKTINDIRSRCLANKISNIPSLMHLANMFDTSGPPSKDFIATFNVGYWSFHVTQVSPDKMSFFKKATFVRVNKEMTLSQDLETFLDSLEGKRCILLDKAIREIHEFFPHNGGKEIPHLMHPCNESLRVKVHDCLHLQFSALCTV